MGSCQPPARLLVSTHSTLLFLNPSISSHRDSSPPYPPKTRTNPQTLLQTRGSSTDPRIRHARGMAEALSIIKERDGWKGLRRGMGPRIMTVAPSTAISWLSYEFFSASLLFYLLTCWCERCTRVGCRGGS